MQLMHIQQLAKQLRISPRAIRYYEEAGLIAPRKQDGNRYRLFDEADRQRLQTVLSLRAIGLSIEEVKAVLAELDRGDEDGALHLLELQRSLLFSELVELRLSIDAADRLIGRFRGRHAPDWGEVFDWTEGLKRRRELRANWRDHWNFDRQAETHDHLVLGSGLAPSALPNYAQALRMVAEWVAPRPGERGLDIGTGTGNLAGLFLEKGIEMAGIDQSKEMLRRCRSKFPSMETKLGNVLAIPYLDRSFDFAVSSFALRHLSEEQLPLALEEIRRVLKPHGTLCIADRMLGSAEPMASDHAASPSGLASHETAADLSRLVAWLEQADYLVQTKPLSDLIHIVFAVPIRAGL